MLNMRTITRDQYDQILEVWRADLLYQMDRTMERCERRFKPVPPTRTPGARDADLPRLFEALDAQLRRNLAHRGIEAIVWENNVWRISESVG
jgi:hypothetical protein